MSTNEATPKRPVTLVTYILLALVLAVVVSVRIRLLSVPLERDEGEFAYMGQLLLKGIPPFTHAYTMKLPGVSVAYALFLFLFGQTPAAIHLGLLIVNGASIFLVYLLAGRLLDRNAARLSCASYAVMSLSTGVLGLFAHATHFAVLFSLAGFLVLLRSLDSRRTAPLIISGLCFGLAVTMKQHAAVLAFFALAYYGWRAGRDSPGDKRSAVVGSSLLLLGTVVPYVLLLIWVARTGTFNEFWFWTVQYAREYASGHSLGQTFLSGLESFVSTFSDVVAAQPLLWLLAMGGGGLLCTRHGRCADKVFVFGLLLFSFLSICPGLVFRSHYFVLILPAAAILIGAAVHSAGVFLSSPTGAGYRQFIPHALVMIAISFGIFHEREHFFTLTPLEVSRATHGHNPFSEALQVARYLKDHTTPSDRIAVLGSEPEIYFYADRLSATGYIYMYGLMEDQPHAERMQRQMIREIEQARPKYIVAVNVDFSWLVRPASQRVVLDWGERYVRDLYDVAGVIDIVDFNTTRYAWDGAAAGATPGPGSSLTVFKRKEGM